MSPASREELMARYAELDALLERAIAACQAKDAELAVTLGFAVTQKLTTLDERLLELGLTGAAVGRSADPTVQGVDATLRDRV